MSDLKQTYSVFVRFRRSRLSVLRREPSLLEASRFVERLRAERFHRPEDVILIDDLTGQPAASDPVAQRMESELQVLEVTRRRLVRFHDRLSETAETIRSVLRGSEPELERAVADVNAAREQLARAARALRASTRKGQPAPEPDHNG